MIRNFTLGLAWSICLCLITVPAAHCQQSPRGEQPAAQETAAAPVIIAHRGASGYLPEHTLESATLAHAMNCDFIEQDVVLSHDGIAVVLHDITLDSVTDVATVFPDRRSDDGEYYAADFTFDELSQLTVTERRNVRRRRSGSRFPPGVGNFRIATLEEHLALIAGLNQSRQHEIGIYVEIKRPGWHRKRGLDPSVAVLDILRKSGFERRDDAVLLQCFEFAELQRIRTELNSQLALVQLVSEIPEPLQLDAMASVVDGIGASIRCVVTDPDGAGRVRPTDFVEQCHERSLVVHAWTFRSDDLPAWADSPDALLDILVREAGVDGVFCDQPDIAIAWRTKIASGGPASGPFRLLNERPQKPTSVSNPSPQSR